MFPTPQLADPTSGPDEALDEALDVVGDRWTLRVVGELASGPARFGDLGARLGIATNVLTERLRRLEQAGLVVATPYQRRPLRLEYRLTRDGEGLGGVILQLAAWGAERRGTTGTRPRHGACGTEMELRQWCPTCGVSVVSDSGTGPDDAVWL